MVAHIQFKIASPAGRVWAEPSTPRPRAQEECPHSEPAGRGIGTRRRPGCAKRRAGSHSTAPSRWPWAPWPSRAKGKARSRRDLVIIAPSDEAGKEASAAGR